MVYRSGRFFYPLFADQIRYTIAANAPETADSEFTWKDFQSCNGDLLGKYGNLVNRVLVFAKNQCGGIAPTAHILERVDEEFLQHIQKIAREAAESYEQFKLRKASQLVMELAQIGNVYFDSKRPWQDAKQQETRERMKTTLACCLECLKTLALISFPIIPTTAERVWQMLGYKDTIQQRGWLQVVSEKIPEGQQIPAPIILFQKVEDSQIEEGIQKLQKLSLSQSVKDQKTLTSATPRTSPLKSPITIDDVRKLDLRIGIIRQAEAIPKSKKLLKLKVDIGLEERTIVAGIGESYRTEELIGRSVVIVANLQPATLMGVQSEGMLLAAKQAGELELLFVEHCLPGSEVS